MLSRCRRGLFIMQCWWQRLFQIGLGFEVKYKAYHTYDMKTFGKFRTLNFNDKFVIVSNFNELTFHIVSVHIKTLFHKFKVKKPHKIPVQSKGLWYTYIYNPSILLLANVYMSSRLTIICWGGSIFSVTNSNNLNFD